MRVRGPDGGRSAIAVVAGRSIGRALASVPAVLVAGLLVCGSAVAATTLDTTPSWNGTDHEANFGDTPATPTYGQLVTAPADSVLTSFRFQMRVPTAVVFRGFVFAWDGSKATGPALYESAPTHTTNAAAFQPITFTPAAVPLIAGQQYVLFVSTSEDNWGGSGGNTGQLGWIQGNVYGGGNAVVFNNGADPSMWTSTAWDGNGDGFLDFDFAFTAAFGGPAGATTGAASRVGQTGATLGGTFSPNALATTTFFQYGTSTAYGSQTAEQDAGSGTGTLTQSATLTGLAPDSTVHFRAVARNAAGTSFGADQTFTTTPATASPPPRDETAPSVSIGKLPTRITLKTLLKNGISFSESANEPAAFSNTLLGTTRTATLTRVQASAFNLSLAQRTLPLGTGKRTVKLKPNRRLIGRAKRFKLQLVVTATDASGNHRTTTRTVKVS
jgi:hypothetical protein